MISLYISRALLSLRLFLCCTHLVLLSVETSTQVLALYPYNTVPTMVYQVVFLHEILSPTSINALKCRCSLELVNWSKTFSELGFIYSISKSTCPLRHIPPSLHLEDKSSQIREPFTGTPCTIVPYSLYRVGITRSDGKFNYLKLNIFLMEII